MTAQKIKSGFALIFAGRDEKMAQLLKFVIVDFVRFQLVYSVF